MPGRSKKTEEKQALQVWLEAGRTEDILERMKDRPAAINTLVSMLFQDDPLLMWRLLFLLGPLAQHKAQNNLEGVRNQIRRLLWLMNDESGGIVWYAPQAVATMLAYVPTLRREFARILGSFLGEDPFEEGAHWAVARLATQEPAKLTDLIPRLRQSLDDPRPLIRLYAGMALPALGETRPADEQVLHDEGGILLAGMDAQSGRVRQQDLQSLWNETLFDAQAQWMVGLWSLSESPD